MAHDDVRPDTPSHTPGTAKGEERLRQYGREPGRDDARAGRTARDSTGINADARAPIDPRMPQMPRA
jgi:hypothetical protein